MLSISARQIAMVILAQVAAGSASGPSTQPDRSPPVTLRLYIEKLELSERDVSSVVIAIRNDSAGAITLWSPVVTKQYVLGDDGSRREAQLRVPQVARRGRLQTVPIGLRIILTITGPFEEPAQPPGGVRSVRLEPMKLAHDETQFFVNLIGGRSYWPGTYSLKAEIYDQERLLAESNEHKLVIVADRKECSPSL